MQKPENAPNVQKMPSQIQTVVENADGQMRMNQIWKQKLWIDFDRDNKMDTIQVNDQDAQEVFDLDTDELRLDNHATTEDYLCQLRDHIKFSRDKVQLLRLEIVKVLFTGPKAQLLAETLSDENCQIMELVFDRCRAKSEKMGAIFEALAKNKSVANLTLRNMNIPRDSLTAMGDMLSGDKLNKTGNQTLQMLTLYNTGLSDNSMQILASGLEQSNGLIYLDLRQNNFENLGFQELAKSLTGQPSLLTLRINAVHIEREELQILQNLFSHQSCHIQNLEMEELEINDSLSSSLIEAVTKLKRLFTFDFSNNQLPSQMTQGIADMCNQFPMLEILCLDHCEMTDDICRHVFQSSQNTKLQFLNISWNLLSGDSIGEVVRVVQQNQDLQKLAMQHNRFGEADLSDFAHAIETHQSMLYLDISANQVGNQDFQYLYTAIQNRSSKVGTFHCRKNKVGGAAIDRVLALNISQNIFIIDLTSNKLSEQNSLQLYEYAQVNINLEQLNLGQNMQVSAQITNDINEQCRQNKLIKKRILPMLQNLKNLVQSISIRNRNNCYAKYDVSELSLVDQKLLEGDFVQKFIKQNQKTCKKLELTRLELGPGQTQILHMFDPQTSQLNFLSILHMEDLKLSSKAMRRVLRNLRKMRELTELHLVNLQELEPLMDTLAESIQKHKKLKVLDLRQNVLRTRDVSSLVPLLAENKVITELDISNSTISKKNMMHLWMALHVNISVCNLKYSRTNFLSITEMVAIEHELDLNLKIKESISPQVLEFQRKNNTNKVMSLHGMPYQPQMNPAIIKYVKTHQKLRSLDLSKTGLRIKDITLFIEEIAKQNIRLETLNLSENDHVNHKVVEQLCYLFTSSSTIVNLHLNKTKITLKSVAKIFNSIKDSLKVRTISIQGCKLNLKTRFGQEIVALAKDNISLTQFNYRQNAFDHEFHEGIKAELALNQQIVDQILPQLQDQEKGAREEAQKIKKSQRRGAKEFKIKQKQIKKQESRNSRLQSLRSKKSADKSDVLDVSGLKKTAKKDLISEESYSHRSSNDDNDRRRHSQRGRMDLIPSPGTRKSNPFGIEYRATPELTVQAENDLKPLTIVKRRSSLGDIQTASQRKLLTTKAKSGVQGVKDMQIEESDMEYTSSESESESQHSDSDNSSANDLFITEKFHKNGFDLQMGKCDLSGGIGFVTKFTRVFRSIKEIDFGQQKLDQEQMQDFGDVLKVNKYIQKVCYKKKDVGKNQMHQIEEEIEKNRAIYEVNQAMASGYDVNSKKLDLTSAHLKNLRFLPKMIKEFKNLQTLDLSKADLRTKDSVQHVCKMIDDNDTLESLILQDCNINGNTLSVIADALTMKNNRNLKILDIRKNPIQDTQLKVLFGLLQNNRDILEIKFDLYDEANLQKMEKFRALQEEGQDLMHITHMLEHDDHEHHHHPTPLWQKIIFPIWCWKALIHDKHEAFSFKYDTREIEKVEKIIMPGTKKILYFWTFIYYIIVFVLPPIFKIHACEKTFNNWLFIIYGVYLLLNSIWEIKVVLAIQSLLDNKKLLSFNKWHVVELFMGAIARTDTFLDICFIHILIDCWSAYVNWIVPSLTFAIINLLFPLYMLIKLMRNDLGNALFQPNLESTCFGSFIRENMLLATVLDSFCINNSFYMFGRPFVFGKLMGFMSFFTQDFPQLTIHVLFKLLIFSDEQYYLKKEKLLLYGMVCSSFAVLISLFNLIMCAQNEFDPIIVELELQKRRQDRDKRQSIAQNQTEQYKKQQTVQSIGLFKRQMQQGLNAVMLGGRKRNGTEVELPNAKQDRLSKSNAIQGDGNSSLFKKKNTTSDVTPSSENGMVNSMFFSRVKDQVRVHQGDKSKAAVQLNAYMAYLKDDDNPSKKASSPNSSHRKMQQQPTEQQERVTEELEEDDDAYYSNNVNDTSRNFLLNKQSQNQPSDADVVVNPAPQGNNAKTNKISVAPPANMYDEQNETGHQEIKMQDFPTNNAASSPAKDGLIKNFRKQKTSAEKVAASGEKKIAKPKIMKESKIGTVELQDSFNLTQHELAAASAPIVSQKTVNDAIRMEAGSGNSNNDAALIPASTDALPLGVQKRPSVVKKRKRSRQGENNESPSKIDFFHKPAESPRDQQESSVPTLPPLGGASPQVIMQEDNYRDSPTDQARHDSLGQDHVKPKKKKNSSTSKKQSLAIESNAQEEANDESIKPFSFTSPHSPSQQEAPYNPFSAQATSSPGPGNQVMADAGQMSSENAGQSNRNEPEQRQESRQGNNSQTRGRQQAIITLESGGSRSSNYDEDAKTL